MMPRPDFRGLALAALGIACALAMLTGCGGHTAWKTTPIYAIQVTPNADLARVDAEWKAAAECWGYAGKADAWVTVVPCQTDSAGAEYFCGSHGDCYSGLQTGNQVTICPDLAALRHEFSHRVCQMLYGAAAVCKNYSGRCWL
jgi:hypothetical protein